MSYGVGQKDGHSGWWLQITTLDTMPNYVITNRWILTAVQKQVV